MENKLIDIIYDKIKDINFYNYDNDEELNNISIKEYVNIEGYNVIDIDLKNETYTIECIKTYVGGDE